MAYVVVDKEQLDAGLTVVADAIREKGGTSEQLEFPNGMADAVRDIQSGGGVNLLDYTTSLSYMFYGVDFSKLEIEEIEVEFGKNLQDSTPNNLLNSAFEKSIGLKRIKIDTKLKFLSSLLSCQYAFANCKQLEVLEIPFIENIKVYYFDSMLREASSLIEIVGVFDFSNTHTANSFVLNCQNLQTIRFKPETIGISISFAQSSKLSAESIQSIIYGLADLNGKTSQTLTLHTDVVQKLTQEQLDTISAKNWVVG